MTTEEKEEKDFLFWFYINCDFGPAHEDVMEGYKEYYTKSTGKPLPKGYNDEE